MDPRVEKAQQLFWQAQELGRWGGGRAAVQKYLEMARLHEDRARDLLGATNPDGWIDLYASVTCWGDAGAREDALRLLEWGCQQASSFGDAAKEILRQLSELRVWLRELRVVPSLGDFASPLAFSPVPA